MGELALLSSDERRRILVEWNDTRADYPGEATLPALLGAVRRRAPDVPAVSFGGSAMSYRALDQTSNRIARALQARGVGPGALVGVVVERSSGMVAALLGILKTGAAYVPLDPAYPRERLAFMAEDAKVRALVTEDRLAALLPVPEGGLLRLDGDAAEIDAQRGDPLDVAIDARAAAYVIHTSGSTGRPKGVVVPHRALTNFVTAMARSPGLSPADRLLAVTSLSFDIAGLELWAPLAVGAQVVIASRATATDGAALRAALESGGITVVQATPSTFRLLLEAGWRRTPGLRVLVGGEALPRDLADALLERADAVWNMYGPTETTIWSCAHRLAEREPVLVGRPIANTQVYVLDPGLAPVPPGVTGEVFIGGDGVALGYLGCPDLTAARFVPDPFSTRGGDRLYRTGDLGRQRAVDVDSSICSVECRLPGQGARPPHRARRDRGGFARRARGDPARPWSRRGSRRPATRGSSPTSRRVGRAHGRVSDDVRAHLRTRLPEIMIPWRVVVLAAIPRTANGKIDRRALPPPEGASVGGGGGREARGALELRLLAVWEGVLGVKGVGAQESFFDAGGHSLLAIKLFDRIEHAFGVKLPIASLFQAPTIEAQSELLRREGWTPSWSSLVPIQPRGSRLPFFSVHAVGGNVLNYRLLARHLGPDQPFYGLQARGLSGVEAPYESVEEMAAGYLHEVRQEQPHGPYLLGGASSGGAVAYEMAWQLRRAGEEVRSLVMMDTYLPGPPRHRLGHALDYHLGQSGWSARRSPRSPTWPGGRARTPVAWRGRWARSSAAGVAYAVRNVIGSNPPRARPLPAAALRGHCRDAPVAGRAGPRRADDGRASPGPTWSKAGSWCGASLGTTRTCWTSRRWGRSPRCSRGASPEARRVARRGGHRARARAGHVPPLGRP